MKHLLAVALNLAILLTTAHALTTVNPGADLQAAINADSVRLNAGTYVVGSTVNIPANRTLDSVAGATVKGNLTAPSVRINGSNVTIRGITFQDRGIWIADNIEGWAVDNCRFAITAMSPPGWCSIEFGSARNGRITNNTFAPGAASMGAATIYGYHVDGLLIANNEFIGGTEGIHIIPGANSKGLLIEQNYFAGLRRMGCEIQGGGTDTIVQDNWWESPGPPGPDSMAYSIVCAEAIRPVTRRNVAIQPISSQTPDGIGVRIIFELGGKDLICEDNYSRGGNHVIAVNGSKATGRATNNNVADFREGPRNSNGATATLANNGPAVRLSFDPIARGRPYPNRRYGQTPPPEPPPSTDPIVEVRVIHQSGKVEVSKP